MTKSEVKHRWFNKLDPTLVEGWSQNQEMLFHELHKEHGNKWKKISGQIAGKSEVAVKNFWYGKCRSTQYRAKLETAVRELDGIQTLRDSVFLDHK